jgi:Flp pilus assembly protein TadD
MKMVNLNKTTTLMLGIGACLLLSACQTTSADAQARSGNVDSAIARANSGEKMSLAAAERAYKKSPDDAMAATDYARALREEGALDQAAAVLEPFAKNKDALSYTLSEYSAIFLAKGDSSKAETYAQKAIVKDSTNYKAYHNLGLALETQAKHEEAERAFRKGLELWQGDPTIIMNNLALNLSAQGYLDESIEILRKAQSIAPDRVEIERNLRIVTALQQAARGPTPMPPKKPAS